MLEVGSRSFKRATPRFMVIVVAVVIVILAALAGYFFWQYNALKNNPGAASEAVTQRLTAEVGKVYALPNEKPTVAQISDKSKLAGQAFFNSAQNGDYILIFTNAKLAILYRESTNKLINVGPINIDQNQAQQQSTKATVKLLNASSSSNVTSVANKLQSNFADQVNVDASRDSAKNKASKTVVVAITSGDSGLAQQIADKLGATLSYSAPNGETMPAGADIAIYVAQP